MPSAACTAAVPGRTDPVGEQEFVGLMGRLGPFEPRPRLAAAVSGGADSMALALLAQDWAHSRGGSVMGLIVDHRLRTGSGIEAALAQARLGACGIAARILPLEGLAAGPGLAARARAARHAALSDACRQEGVLHLLLGHHAMDQAETLMMRALSASGSDGLAGMAALRETASVRLLRPLLQVEPSRLRATLWGRGIGWIEDPSNQDRAALRARLRSAVPPATDPAALLARSARVAGCDREAGEAAAAAALAGTASIRPEGFVQITGPLPVTALAALIRSVSGAAYGPAAAGVAALARDPAPATIGGVRLLPAGRLGPGLLLAREEAAIGLPAPARAGALWDGRFRLDRAADAPAGSRIEALGDAAAGLRGLSDLPSAVLRTLPAIRCSGALFAVPHLGYPDPVRCACVKMTFSPPLPAAGAPFVPG